MVTSGPSAALTPGQIASLLKEAGWPADEIPRAIAIVIGESGGRPGAIGDQHLENGTWGPSVGLFQIRSLRSEKGKGTTRDQIANMNPLTNARHALTIRKSQGLTAWTVYNTGAYLQYMGKAMAGVASPVAYTVANAGLSVTNADFLPDLPGSDSLETIRGWLKQWADGTLIVRGVMLAGGFFCLIAAAMLTLFGNDATKKTAKVVGKVAVLAATKGKGGKGKAL